MAKDVVVITGGTGGIGHCLSEGFHRLGYLVYALDQRCLKPLSEGIEFKQVDLREAAKIECVMAKIGQETGGIHLLINNAAIAHYNESLETLDLQSLNDLLDVNLKAMILTSKAFLKANEGKSYGRIINIASTRYAQNEVNWELYGASKGGVVAFTQSLAVSLSGRPITVNAISPGWICTDPGEYELLSEKDHNQHPSGRVGKPEDILKACLYFADPENDFVNGINLVVDGGMSRKMIYLE